MGGARGTVRTIEYQDNENVICKPSSPAKKNKRITNRFGGNNNTV